MLSISTTKGRKLGRTSEQRDLGTAAGLVDGSLEFESNLQNKTGNLYFTAVIRVDIVKNRSPIKLESEGIAPPLPARKAQSTYIWQDYGKPKF
jgi:hypothetical protein